MGAASMGCAVLGLNRWVQWTCGRGGGGRTKIGGGISGCRRRLRCLGRPMTGVGTGIATSMCWGSGGGGGDGGAGAGGVGGGGGGVDGSFGFFFFFFLLVRFLRKMFLTTFFFFSPTAKKITVIAPAAKELIIPNMVATKSAIQWPISSSVNKHAAVISVSIILYG